MQTHTLLRAETQVPRPDLTAFTERALRVGLPTALHPPRPATRGEQALGLGVLSHLRRPGVRPITSSPLGLGTKKHGRSGIHRGRGFESGLEQSSLCVLEPS